MHHLMTAIAQYGLAFVFLNVLIAQAGAPIPVYPTLIMTGALVARGDYTAWELLLTAVLASVIADLAWYFAGARFGRPVLKLMCRISLSPDSCVRQTESTYTRFGARSLVFAKFIPGFAAVATALAGSTRTPIGIFIVYDALGAALWASVGIGIGLLFRNTVETLLAELSALGHIGLLLIAVALVVFVLAKWWQRHAFLRELRMARVTVDELKLLLSTDTPPVLLDVRSDAAQRAEGRIPGAVAISIENFAQALDLLPGDGEVVVYCACPNEVSAAKIAKMLKAHGYSRVRPLLGGIDAWVAGGNPVEHFLETVLA